MMVELRKNHFEIGNKKEQPDYQSIAKMSQEQAPDAGAIAIEAYQKIEEAKMNSRKPNFRIGSSAVEPQFESKSYKGYDPNESGSLISSNIIKERMQKGNFSIGDERNRAL